MTLLSEHASTRLFQAGAIAFLLALIVGGWWLKLGFPESDYQRLNALEERVDRLEHARVILLEPIEPIE